MKEIAKLPDVLAYNNEKLVTLFSMKKGVSIEESNVLFLELKRWLWFLAQREEKSQPFPVFGEQSIIDDYWHEFILNTHDYHEFCNKFFHRYIHHAPTIDGTLEEGAGFGLPYALYKKNKQEYISRKLAMLKEAMKEVAAALGPETVKRWYQDIPNTYFYNK